MIAEPTFTASLDGLCGFILVVEDGDVDAYTPSGDLLGVKVAIRLSLRSAVH
jgi:hypothetical protein